MTDRAPRELLDLVGRYAENRESYRKTTYNETQARREFIDPLFDLLGWDVGNKQGFAEAYKPVVHEDRVKVGGRTKAPDYSFRIGGTRKFFLEAKKPSADVVKDREAALQLRRYAWSAKLPLSILTNVEHLAVYDCRIRPSAGDAAGTARLMLIRYDELPAKWDELVAIFSLNAIQRGAFDRYAEDTRPRRGTVAVDDDFLDEIERWRVLLAWAFLRQNKLLDTYDLNDAVQKTIDRLVFLRIAEDRGIEPFGKLKQIANGQDVYVSLSKSFRESDRRYNSGLFHFDPNEGDRDTLDTTTLNLKLADKPLRDVILSLYPPRSAYEFSVIPADILGQVYERFLGKTIKIKGRSIEIDEKPDVKKAGGVYYTPTFVVRHIVKNIVAALTSGKTPTDISGERSSSRPIRIVDPACGSGSFLIEVYQELLDWYLLQYITEPSRYSRGSAPKIFQGPHGEWRLSISEKKRVLLAHIYGVDVDPQAVEVTKLSLLLKVLEGESSDLVASQVSFLDNQRVLPDLGSRIKCGNSIIAKDFYGLFDPAQFSVEHCTRSMFLTGARAFRMYSQMEGSTQWLGILHTVPLFFRRKKTIWPRNIRGSPISSTPI